MVSFAGRQGGELPLTAYTRKVWKMEQAKSLYKQVAGKIFEKKREKVIIYSQA
jgi:hypothetical protein